MDGPTIEQFKEVQRETWAAGDYADLSRHIEPVGRRLVDTLSVKTGSTLLDVACGTGNAAIPAAVKGARVTGLDLVPKLLAGGRKQAADAGVEIEWVEGDAESLPFDDNSFDYVVSTFGHMFAPRHRVAADELARVCRPGGTLGICCWTPEGTVGQTFRTAAPFMPSPPEYASPPVLWGTREHVQELFAGVASEFAFEEHSATIEWESTDSFADYFMERFPVMVTARRMLGERFTELRQSIVDNWRAANRATDGTLYLPQEYLQSVVRLG